jgi:hypothetical protein
MAKTFKQPPKGPKLGPVKDFKELTPEQREKIGDFDVVSKPAPLDPRLVAAEKAAQEAPKEPETVEEAHEPTEDAAEQLEALHSVLEQQEEEPDYEEEELQKAAAPTQDDLRNFMRCLFGDTPYRKEYKLFGGMLIVEMTDVSPEVEDRIFVQLSIDQREDKIETQDDWDLALDRYRMAVNIRKVVWSGQDIIKEKDDTEYGTLREIVEARIVKGLKNSVVYRALLRATRIFRRHLNIMLERSMDSDFWQVDGSSSRQEAT